MPDHPPQSFASHTRWHPPFHFFLMPVLVLTLILSIWRMIKDPSFDSAWHSLFVAAVLVGGFLIRLNALKVQDRVIRLEERLRLLSVLSEPLRSRVGDLTESQLVALRFAPDAELAGLVEKAL